MHELSICSAIADIATRHAGERRVETIHVQVGQLRQIVPDTLVYCWGLVTESTALSGSRIAVDNVAATIACHACRATTEIGDWPVFACGSCGGSDVEVATGEEFLITSLDLAEA